MLDHIDSSYVHVDLLILYADGHLSFCCVQKLSLISIMMIIFHSCRGREVSFEEFAVHSLQDRRRGDPEELTGRVLPECAFPGVSRKESTTRSNQ